MRSTRRPQSTTSLPQSRRDEESSRLRAYFITMSVRVACFVLMVAITPYGWYTFVLGIGAIFLPYVAVILANVGRDAHAAVAEDPRRALPAPSIAPPAQDAPPPRVIRVTEGDGTGSRS